MPLLDKPALPIHTKHQLELPKRRVFFGTLGDGPALVFIHMSPLDSSHVLHLASQLQNDFTCILPDSPGYGKSDPLPVDSPSIEDYADALHEFLTELGIKECFVYGSHTGAKIALVIGSKYPNLVEAVALDGLRITSKEQREQRKSGYAPKIVAVTDGSHLQTTWERVLETSKAWYVPNPNFPELPQLINLMRSELAAKPWYGQAYSAAFAFDPMPTLEAYQKPALFVARHVDKLSLDCINKLPKKENISSVQSQDDGTEVPAAADLSEFFKKLSSNVPAASPIIEATKTTWVTTDFGTSRVRNLNQGNPTEVWLDSIALLDSPSENAFSIQLPGFGDSIWNDENAISSVNLIEHLRQVITKCQVDIKEEALIKLVNLDQMVNLNQLVNDAINIVPDREGKFWHDLWNKALNFQKNIGSEDPIQATDLIFDLLSLQKVSSEMTNLFSDFGQSSFRATK